MNFHRIPYAQIPSGFRLWPRSLPFFESCLARGKSQLSKSKFDMLRKTTQIQKKVPHRCLLPLLYK